MPKFSTKYKQLIFGEMSLPTSICIDRSEFENPEMTQVYMEMTTVSKVSF